MGSGTVNGFYAGFPFGASGVRAESTMAFWTVIQTKMNAEEKVELNLRKQAFEFYNPKYRKSSGKITSVFPRYMFVYIEDRWRSLRSTFGVSQLLMSNETTPAFVSDDVISALKRKEIKGLVPLVGEKFLPDEELEILDGPMKGFVGLYKGAQDGDRIVVLMSLLNRKVRVIVRDREVERICGLERL